MFKHRPDQSVSSLILSLDQVKGRSCARRIDVSSRNRVVVSV